VAASSSAFMTCSFLFDTRHRIQHARNRAAPDDVPALADDTVDNFGARRARLPERDNGPPRNATQAQEQTGGPGGLPAKVLFFKSEPDKVHR
ncbi:MAG TPA: hypothetical protein VFR19_18770, partial [Hyphomicrobiaceae bacterium]|nr:hypothetical protein [Hyphomicrobiaceae bacterium]